MANNNIKGEKYIYLLMALEGCQRNGGIFRIGKDNGMVGGQGKYRRFSLDKKDGLTLLSEHRRTKAMSIESRWFHVCGELGATPTIYPYINGTDDMSNWYDW